MADELPPPLAQQQQAAADQQQLQQQPQKKYNYLGYEMLQPGQTPTPGVSYATGEYSGQLTRYNSYGSVEIFSANNQVNPNAPKESLPAPGPTGLYISYQGLQANLSATYSAGAQPYTPNPLLESGYLYNPNSGNLVAGGGNIVGVSQGVGGGGMWTGEKGQARGSLAEEQAYMSGNQGAQQSAFLAAGGGQSKNALSAAADAANLEAKAGKTIIASSGGAYFAEGFQNNDPSATAAANAAREQVTASGLKGGADFSDVRMAQPGLEISPGVYTTGDISKVEPVTTFPTTPAVKSPGFDLNPIAVGGAVFGAAYAGTELLKAGGEAWFSGVQKTAESGADAFSSATGGIGSRQANVVAGYGSGLIGGIPAFVASVPFAAAWSVTHPFEVPGKAAEIGYNTLDEIVIKSEERRPGSGAGAFAAMFAGGKVVEATGIPKATVGAIKSASPVDVAFAKIPTASGETANYVATVSTKMPGSVELPTPRAYALFGSEVEGLRVGTGSPVPAAVEAGISVRAPALFNVRDTSVTATQSQVQFLDPFFREVSKGTTEEPIVNAMFDLKQALPRSEAALSYEKLQAQPIGSVKQVGISPETRAQVFEVVATTDAKYAGSQALAETIGEKYVRPVAESDIDLSMSKAYQDASFQQLKEVYAKNPESVVTGGQSSRGYSFKSEALPEEHTLGVVGETPDVRTYNAATAEGSIVKTQTPEYSIESKASRALGPDLGIGGKSGAPSRLAYTPEEGTSFNLGGKKPTSDIADIYAASRGIARGAYQEKYYDLGAKYEGISENIKTYAESTGTAEKIATIPEDALAGVQKAPVSFGSILGVDLELGLKTSTSTEYPVYKATTSTPLFSIAPTSEVATTTTTKTKANTFSGKTPEDYYPTTSEPVQTQGAPTFSGNYAEYYTKGAEPAPRGTAPTFSGYTPDDYAKAKESKDKGEKYPAGQEKKAVESTYPETTTLLKSVSAYPESTDLSSSYPAGEALTSSYPAGTSASSAYPSGAAPVTSYPTGPIVSGSYPAANPAAVGAPGFLDVKATGPVPFILPFEDETRKRKTPRGKGKRFGEVFSFDVDKNFKVPTRLTRTSTPKRFTESFAMDTKSTFGGSKYSKLTSPFESIKPKKSRSNSSKRKK